jgi:DNA replication protein DnaC
MRVPPRYADADIDKVANIEPVREFLRHSTPPGFLVVHGGCGCGKTHLACAIKNRCDQAKRPCELVFSQDLFIKLRRSFDKHSEESEEYIINRYAPDCDGKTDQLAIFDDVGAQNLTPYVIDAWYIIIDRRYRNNQKTIFTSNLTIEEISDRMTDRIGSRLASGLIFNMGNRDRRLEG